jgi:hypothetical protein
VVVAVDGEPVTGVDDLVRLLNGNRIGREVVFCVLRQGALVEAKLVQPSDEGRRRAGAAANAGEARRSPWLPRRSRSASAFLRVGITVGAHSFPSKAVQRRFLSFGLTFLVAVVAFAVAGAAFTVRVDPLNYYRVPTSRPPLFQAGMQRYQNVGLARNLSYDTVILGSSLMDNMRASIVNRSWGVRSVKLSISGSTSLEQRLIAEQALGTGQVKRVLWSVEAFTYAPGPDALRLNPYPWYMYRSAFANAKYPLSLNFLQLSWWVRQGYGQPDLDKLDTWDDQFEFSQKAVLKAFHGTCENFKSSNFRPEYRPPDELLAAMRAALDRNLLSVIKANPGVTFEVLLPPFSVLSYYEVGSTLFIQVPFRDMLAPLVELPNVRLHDLAIAHEITFDLNRYMDLLHFDHGTTERVANEIRDGRWIVRDAGGLARNTAELIRQVESFDACRLGIIAGQEASATAAPLH